jgi:hypothetical protein
MNSGGVPQSLHFSRTLRELVGSKSSGIGFENEHIVQIQFAFGLGAGDDGVLAAESGIVELLGDCPTPREVTALIRNRVTLADDLKNPA